MSGRRSIWTTREGVLLILVAVFIICWGLYELNRLVQEAVNPPKPAIKQTDKKAKQPKD